MINYYKTLQALYFTFIMILIMDACEPLVTEFDDVEDGKIYKTSIYRKPHENTAKLKIMTWNIRFGAGRIPWFGDSCGDRVILSEDEVVNNLSEIAAIINRIGPDILLLNEIDISSKRSAYIDQVQWLLDATHLNYGAYASVWKAQFIPSDGLGRMNMGNAVLSRYPISEAKRLKLPLRGDQDALTKYFYLRRNILKTKIDVPDAENFYVLVTHLSAFSTDDTKKRQVDQFKAKLDRLHEEEAIIIAGGDLNLLPPGSDSTDFCDEDKCPGEHFHGRYDDPKHKEGSYFTPEMTWLQPLYHQYYFAVPLARYLNDQNRYFTHSPKKENFWDRKLDYLISNQPWISNSDSTYQDLTDHSDHAAVSALLEISK